MKLYIFICCILIATGGSAQKRNEIFEEFRFRLLQNNKDLKDVAYDSSSCILTQTFKDGNKTVSYLPNINSRSQSYVDQEYDQSYTRLTGVSVKFVAWSNSIGSVLIKKDGTQEQRNFCKFFMEVTPANKEDREWIILIFLSFLFDCGKK